MGDVRLFVLVRGDFLNQSFPVVISRDMDIACLRQRIVAQGMLGVAEHWVALFRISVACDGRLNLEDSRPLFPRDVIGTLFPDSPGEAEYVLVVVGMMLHRYCYAHVANHYVRASRFEGCLAGGRSYFDRWASHGRNGSGK